GVPVHAQLPDSRLDLRPRGRHRAAVAESPEVLRGIEAPRGRIAERARRPAAERRTVRLRAVLDEKEALRLREVGDRVDVREAAIQVNRYDRLGPAREGGLEPGGIHREVLGF